MKYLGVFIFLVAFSNCNSTNAVNSKNNQTEEQSELGGTYLVTTLYGNDVSEHKITVIINSKNKTISGYSGCNTYSCSYTIKGKSFSSSFPMASKRYCEDTADIERAFFKAISEINQHIIQENILDLLNTANEKVLSAKTTL